MYRSICSKALTLLLLLSLTFAVTAQEENVMSSGEDQEIIDEGDLGDGESSPTVSENDTDIAEPIVEAENIDLSKPTAQPAAEEVLPEVDPADTESAAPLAEVEGQIGDKDNSPKAESVAEDGDDADKADKGKTENADLAELKPVFVLLGKSIVPGTTTRLEWKLDQQFDGIGAPTPVLVAHGSEPGPKLCLTAAIHGDELTGIEIVRRVMYAVDPMELKGTVIGVPIVNLQGFLRSSRYLTDRRDLNRFFPGSRMGSSASRIAYSFFKHVIRRCDLLVDLHTGSFYRTNLPQLRADLNNPEVLKFTKAFDNIAVLHSEGAEGTLRRSAVAIGIPAVTLEAGGPMELDETYVSQGAKSVNTMLDKLGMLNTMSFWSTPQPAYYRSLWVRANQGGILFNDIKLGEKVRKGDLLGKVTDPITNVRSLIHSPVNGRVIGMAVNQVVLPGFAAYHIGIDSDSSDTGAVINDGGEGSQDIDEEEEAGGDTFD